MARIRPFKGIRYDRAKVGSLDAVAAPPYDVISPEEEQRYYAQHPSNVIRLILPKANGSKYENAAECLDDWLSAGILTQDKEPCLYACEEEFEVGGRRKKRLGFTCLVRLEDYESRTVLPHENVLAGPREDRLHLIRATRANFDSVFGLHADGRVEKILRLFLAGLPDASAVNKDGVRTNVWRISDTEAIEAAAQILADEPIVIADGHHRYSAALAYRDEVRARTKVPDPDAPHEYVMMTLVSLEDDGLMVLPTHRLVRNLGNLHAAAFTSRLGEFFEIRESADRLMETVASAGGHVLGMHLSGKSYILRLRPESAIDTPGSDALKRLDVSVLHSLILEKLLGIGEHNLSAQSNLSYTRDHGEALRSVDRGEYQIAFLMNGPEVEEIRAVAAAGDRMPQKSTFFYPKLLTGLVMRVMPRLVASC